MKNIAQVTDGNYYFSGIIIVADHPGEHLIGCPMLFYTATSDLLRFVGPTPSKRILFGYGGGQLKQNC